MIFDNFLPENVIFMQKIILFGQIMSKIVFLSVLFTPDQLILSFFGLIIDYSTEIKNFMILKHDFGTIQEHEFHPIFDENENFGFRI